MGKFEILLLLFGAVAVSSKASSIWQYNIPFRNIHNDYQDYDEIQKPCDEQAEKFKPQFEIPEGPKLGELSLSENRLPPAPQAPFFEGVYAPSVEIPKLPALSLPEFNFIVEKPEKPAEDYKPHIIANIPDGPTLQDFSWSSAAVKVEESAPKLPALPSFTYEIPAKIEASAPAAAPCGIFELPSFSPAEVIVKNPWELSTNYAQSLTPAWSAPLEEIHINSIPELPSLTVPEFYIEQAESTVAEEPKSEPLNFASIPKGPVLPPLSFSGVPAAIELPAPQLAPVSIPKIPALPALAPPAFPTRIIIEEESAVPKPCDHAITYSVDAAPALPEININTIEVIHEESKHSLQIPDGPQLPSFAFSHNIELEAAKPEPDSELPKLEALPAFAWPEQAYIAESPEPIMQLGPIPEGPSLPALAYPSFSAKVEIDETAEIHESAFAPALPAPHFFTPAIDVPEPPKLGEINLEGIRFPEIRVPAAPIESSTPCDCDKKAAFAPIYVPEYPNWSAPESNDVFLRLPEINYRINPQPRVIVTEAPEYASYYSPKYCVENIVKERVLPNLISGPKELALIPDGPKLAPFNYNSLPVV